MPVIACIRNAISKGKGLSERQRACDERDRARGAHFAHHERRFYIGNAGEKTALVMGEVRTPRSIPLVTGTLSLREALALANGIPYTGDDRHIQIIRGQTLCPKIFVLSMKCVLHEPNSRLLLM